MTLEHEWDLKSVDFPLTPDSVVVEIGGYVGRWAKEMVARHDPTIYVFEPQLWAFEKCKEALLPNKKARLFNVGLAQHNGIFPMGNWETDGCSLVDLPANKPMGEGNFITPDEFLKVMNVSHIDVCLMNIEGYEFALIPHMIETGFLERVDYFMCQFHLFNRREDDYYRLRSELGKTKKLRFDYGPILTCWEPK